MIEIIDNRIPGRKDKFENVKLLEIFETGGELYLKTTMYDAVRLNVGMNGDYNSEDIYRLGNSFDVNVLKTKITITIEK